MTTPDKDILKSLRENAVEKIDAAKQAEEWFELYRDGKPLPEQGQQLVDCFKLDILTGLQHEADNIHNGGDIVPSGVVGTFQNEKGEEGHIVHLDSTSDAGWRDDVPDESKPDQENMSTPQEGEHIIEKTQAHDHGGMVVEGDEWKYGTSNINKIVKIEDGKAFAKSEYSDDGIGSSILVSKLLEGGTLIKSSPLREQDKQDEQETIVEGSQEKPAEEDTGAVSEVETSTSIESDEEDYPSSDETLEEPSRTGGLEEGARNNGTVTEANHSLASWIMEQEWVENITADITESEKISYVMGEYVLEGGTVVNIEELFSDFTPKGWERYSEATTRNGLNYDFVEPTGEVWINQTHQDLMDVANAVHVLFIREHQPESKEDEQETNPANSTIPSATYTATVMGFTEDVCDDSPANSERADVGRDQEPSGADGESTPEDNGLEYLIKEQAKELTEEQQQAIDLIKGRTHDAKTF